MELGDHMFCFDNSFSHFTDKLVFFAVVDDSRGMSEEDWSKFGNEGLELDVKVEDIRVSLSSRVHGHCIVCAKFMMHGDINGKEKLSINAMKRVAAGVYEFLAILSLQNTQAIELTTDRTAVSFPSANTW